MQLHIVAIGRKKSEYDAQIQEYQKRIVAPFSLTMEIMDPLGIDNPDQCRTRESEKLAAKLKPGDYVIALDERGRDFTTIEFSNLLEKQLHAATKRVVFIIGGAYGLDESIRASASLILRLGAMTMPHELARLVIVEQVYRVTNVVGGGKYHHQ